MMDHHARHLSSPSPTSPFLFHHSERSSFSKSNPLTPLLSSTALDVTNGVDDCFSSPTPPSHHNSHNSHHNHHNSHHTHHHHHSHHSPFESVVDQRSQSPNLDHHHNHHHHHHHQHHHLSSNHNSSSSNHNSGGSNHRYQNGHHLHNNNNNNNSNSNSNHHHHHLNHHSDSLTGVDDDDDEDAMHNMLSGGSSSSSSSTMPLLTESHSHHSFSRISLEEYSPLSLVEDCDTALPISPTSLACASHNSFRSSLNGLNKIDNLVVGVDVNDVVDVNDARSLSPSLLSSSNNHHHHQQHHNHHSSSHGGPGHHQHGSSSSNNHVLWSNSSTAISQNTSILNSHSSASFLLLNQHHQLSSLMQQLEPQSLDEPPQPPCLISSNLSPTNNFAGDTSAGLGSSSINFNDMIGASMSLHRPSSEPPPSCGTESAVSDLECQSLNGQQLNISSSKQTKQQQQQQQQQQQSNKVTNNGSVQSTPTRTRRNRSKSTAAAATAAKQFADSIISNNRKQEADKAGEQPAVAHSSKVHLQLNHHKKLQELQRRLFGIQTIASESAEIPTIDDGIVADSEKSVSNDQTTITSQTSCSEPTSSSNNEIVRIKQEPDSSAGNGDDTPSEIQQLESVAATETNSKTSTVPTRVRPSRSRRSRAKTSASKSLSSVQEESPSTGQKLVATEKVEPDTTTKSSGSDFTKLVDLLSNSSSKANNQDNSFSNNNISMSIQESSASVSEATTSAAVGIESGTGKRTVQTIQVQMSPSLTVMAANANGLLQPITIQQQQQQAHDNGSSGLIATSNCGATFTTNQIFCRAQPGGGNAQLKGIVSNNEVLKSSHNENNVMTTWTLQPASTTTTTNNNTNQNNGNNQQTATIGAHQIAIQVICQDGTSLVLPVSSAAGLNAAVSLTSQHQQLQAVLANVNHHQRNNNGGTSQNQPTTILPLMSVSNIVAQQQTNSGIESSSTTSTNNSGSGHVSSGLAASSPTLAALLDAGSSNRSGLNGSSGGQSFVSNDLLRKLVSGVGVGNVNGPQRVQIKRGEPNQLGQATDVTFTTVNGGSLIISSPATMANVSQPESAKQKSHAAAAGSEKRVKLENADEVSSVNNAPATFTLVDPQGLIITGELDKSSKQAQLVQHSATSSGAASAASNATNQQSAVVKVTSENWKQTKMGSSTGNRQVDPTQPFRCEHCNSTFTRLGNFTRHKKIHTVPTKDGQRFKCDVCSKSFLQRCDLARHLHIHRGTEPHRCNICGKGYIRHSDLVTHQRFHNKEKPFGCPQCSKGFCQRGDLNRHLRSIHLQMKPILCPCCNRKFAKQETLLRHLNTAHRSKPGTTNTTTTTVIAKLSPNYSLAQGDDKQQQQQQQQQQTPAITIVTANAVALNNDNNTQKNPTVASLQAIQATLCNIPQSVDPSTTTSVTSPSITTSSTTEQDPAATPAKAGS